MLCFSVFFFFGCLGNGAVGVIEFFFACLFEKILDFDLR
uniref:Uncharacterized protein n=1 Tax=Rhizophora mucronata TaxID=61149 RepID=A0A2P2QWZ1_RHIMU